MGRLAQDIKLGEGDIKGGGGIQSDGICLPESPLRVMEPHSPGGRLDTCPPMGRSQLIPCFASRLCEHGVCFSPGLFCCPAPILTPRSAVPSSPVPQQTERSLET